MPNFDTTENVFKKRSKKDCFKPIVVGLVFLFIFSWGKIILQSLVKVKCLKMLEVFYLKNDPILDISFSQPFLTDYLKQRKVFI